MRPAYSNKDTGASDGSDRARAAGWRHSPFAPEPREIIEHRGDGGLARPPFVLRGRTKSAPSVLIVSRRVHPRLSGALFQPRAEAATPRLAGLLIWRKVGDDRHAGRDIEADALSRRARPR